jgi:dihydroxy-acid dehydratase
MAGKGDKPRLRSRQWFDNPDNPGMTALYLERYLNYGLTREELQGDKPIIGIAQTGSDLSPCNRHHIELAKRVRDGITAAGGLVFEFPCHPIQETGKRPTASLDRNLAYLSLVEVLYGYPLDGVVLTIGCDKTTPALLMGAATVNLPAIALSVGPMLNGWFRGQRTGSGTIVWKAREMLAAEEIDIDGFTDIVASAAPSVGYCNTMGTATTMNSLAEALGMQLPGSAAIPAPYRERGQMAYQTGRRIVDMVREDLKPSDVMTREAFENAIVVNSAIGGSTNAPIHLNAIARHLGVELTNDRQRQDDGRQLPGCRKHGRKCHPARFRPDKEGRRLHQPARQPVRQRDHEDQRDFEGVPRPLPVQSGRPRSLRGYRRGVRGDGRLPPPHRGTRSRRGRALDPVHSRLGTDWLSGRRRGGEHAAAGQPS